MQLWLKGSGTRLRIPVLPSSYSVKTSQVNTVQNINALGDINLLGKRGLDELSWSAFFPKYFDRGYCEYSGFPSPDACVKRIKRMERGGTVKVTITGKLTQEMTIESFEYGESDGTGDISYSITLKEYRRISIPVAVLTVATPSATVEASNNSRSGEPAVAQAKTYTVESGDCLSSIARKLTGSANWQALYEQNKSVIGSNPNLIYPGQVLMIPG
jgi:nucleoid-associated protein YgaU